MKSLIPIAIWNEFSFGQKIKKALATSADEKEKFPCLPTMLSQPLAIIRVRERDILYRVIEKSLTLYEAASYLLIFCVLLFIYKSKKIKRRNGLMVGVLFILMFVARFMIEFVKENQVEFEDSLTLNMGQILSIPLILLGIAITLYSKKSKNIYS